MNRSCSRARRPLELTGDELADAGRRIFSASAEGFGLMVYRVNDGLWQICDGQDITVCGFPVTWTAPTRAFASAPVTFGIYRIVP